MMIASSPAAASRTFRAVQGGTAAELAAAINDLFAALPPPTYVLGIDFAGAGAGEQWAAELLTSPTLPVAANVNYAFAGTPAVPAGGAFLASGLLCVIGQGGTAAEATAALAAQVSAGTVLATGLVGSSAGGQWIAWAIELT